MGNWFNTIKNISDLTDTMDTQNAKSQIVSNIEFKGANVWILIFAIVIASVGLNVNSIPVVIGAMLISPLMGPIVGIGLALGINDTALLKRSFKNLLIMAGISIVASTFYFIISPLALEAPTELLARTTPTIYDVLIAFFGGLAVIVELCKKDKGTVIAGVAIATALMPPLCTAGYGIANGNFLYFIGAFYLFFINSTFIALATFIMVRYMKFPLVKFADEAKRKKVKRIISLVTIILILPSIYTAIIVIKENSFLKSVKTFVSENKNFDNGYIYNYSIQHRAIKSPTLTIDIAGEKLTDTEIKRLNASLAKLNIKPEQLIINQTTTSSRLDATENSIMVKNIFEHNAGEVKKREEYIAKLENEIKKYKAATIIPVVQIEKELKAQYPSATSIIVAKGFKADNGTSIPTAVAVIHFKNRMKNTDIVKINNWLKARLEVENIEVIQQY